MRALCYNRENKDVIPTVASVDLIAFDLQNKMPT